MVFGLLLPLPCVCRARAERTDRTVWVSGLPGSIREQELASLLAAAGDVETITIRRKKDEDHKSWALGKPVMKPPAMKPCMTDIYLHI